MFWDKSNFLKSALYGKQTKCWHNILNNFQQISILPFTASGRTADRIAMRTDLEKINKVIEDHTNFLAPYQFLTAFSQLISRICHFHDDVFARLKGIIVKVFLAYPQQAMWMMTAVCKVIKWCGNNFSDNIENDFLRSLSGSGVIWSTVKLP